MMASLLGGCAGGESPANPNLLAPKAILAAKPDGNATIYVHSAFGDHEYDWIEVVLDNVTLENRTDVFSFEADVPEPHYMLEVSAGAGNQVYHLRSRIDIASGREKALVAIENDDGTWGDAKSFGLPWEHILNRRSTA